jgi:prepilin-type N-terminal cleavage/methylation domain-containing protein/prepilin-type processing-associated H-X9-DG protein
MSKRSAFTLIELLVVIAVIAILMSILMPALARVKQQAQSVACQARLREWGLLFKLYTDDHEGDFNPGWDIGEEALWMNTMRPYYKDNWDMLLCPTATRVVEGGQDWGVYKAQPRTIPNVYPAPGEGAQKEFIFSYGINSWTNNMTKNRGQRLKEYFWKNVSSNALNPNTMAPEAANRNNIPVFGDATWHDAWPWPQDQPPPVPEAAGWGSFGTSDEMWHFCIDRHNGFVNMLFMDWSTRHVGLKELWTLRWHRAYETAGPWTKAGGVAPSDWPEWLRRFKDY